MSCHVKPRANGRNIVGQQLPTLLDLCCVRLHTQFNVVVCCCVLLGVVAQSLKPVKRLAKCKRTQQLPTLMAYSVSKLVIRILSFQRWETGKRQGGVGRGSHPLLSQIC